MSNRPPKDVADRVKAAGYRLLIEGNYLNNNRVENGQLLNTLVSHVKVGKVLSEYMSSEQVRTYIKDTIINRYAKDENAKGLSLSNMLARIAEAEGCQVESLEDASRKSNAILLKKSTGEVIAAGIGTVSKWETAVRRVLEFIERSPGLPPHNETLIVYIIISAAGKSIAHSDKLQIERALNLVGIKVLFV